MFIGVTFLYGGCSALIATTCKDDNKWTGHLFYPASSKTWDRAHNRATHAKADTSHNNPPTQKHGLRLNITRRCNRQALSERAVPPTCGRSFRDVREGFVYAEARLFASPAPGPSVPRTHVAQVHRSEEHQHREVVGPAVDHSVSGERRQAGT